MARHYEKKNCIRLKAPDYLLLSLFPWFIFCICTLFNNKWFITVKSMPVSNLMMVKTIWLNIQIRNVHWFKEDFDIKGYNFVDQVMVISQCMKRV